MENKSEQGEIVKIGNTDTILTKKKTTIQCKHWVFTLNNYGQEDIEQYEQVFREMCSKWIFGKEVGDSGTPHLQGYLEFKVKRRITECKKILPRAHWEKCNNINASIEYCKKDGDWNSSIDLEEIECISKLYDWQEKLMEIIKIEPDDRTIHWYWESKGNTGKSEFSKYLGMKHNACIIQKGKYGDIMNRVYNHTDMEIFVIDVPRSSKDNVSYNAIDSIKSGIIFNSKYKTGQKFINSPHIIVFANCPPDESKLSKDRWNIVNIDNLDDIPEEIHETDCF